MSISEISIAEFMPIHDQGIYLVDVREIDEYESGHVAGAINIPLSEFRVEYLSYQAGRST